jgi:hypothetical protein
LRVKVYICKKLLSDTLEKVQHLFRPGFEKVYIVSFEDCSMIQLTIYTFSKPGLNKCCTFSKVSDNNFLHFQVILLYHLSFCYFLIHCPMIPELEANPLLKCGKWYVSTGKEWIFKLRNHRTIFETNNIYLFKVWSK